MFKTIVTGTTAFELELKSWIFESLFQRWMLKAPLSDFCIVNATTDVLDG